MILTSERTTVEPDITVLSLGGRLVLGKQCQDMEDYIQRLKSENVSKLVLDLSKLDYIDSAGLGMLAMSQATLRNAGGEMRIAAPSGRVRLALEITHLDTLIPIFPDLESACKGL